MNERIKAMLAERQAALDAAKAIQATAKSEERDLTDDEATAIGDHIATAQAKKSEVETARKKIALVAALDTESAWADQSQPIAAKPIVAAIPEADVNVEIVGGRDSLKFNSLGEQLSKIRDAGSPGGMMSIDPRLMQAAISGSGTTIGSDGGFLVQNDFSSEILRKAHAESPILSRVRKIQIGPDSDGLTMNAIDESSRAAGSRWGGVTVSRAAQGAQGSGSKPILRQVKWNLKKLFGLWFATDELLKDSTAMESIAQQAFSEEIAFVTADEVINGDGASQMKGLLVSQSLVSVAKEGGQAAQTLVKENIDKMFARCFAASRLNAVWLINQDVEPQLYSMTQDVGTGGAPVFLPPGNSLANAPHGTLYGLPIIPTEHQATLGTKGDIMLVDLSEYIMIEKGGVDAMASIHLRFDFDETVFRWIVRNDGQTPWNVALTPAKGTNTLSPFVALNVRA